MAAPNSANQKQGRYSQGGTTEQVGNRLGWWERDVLERSDSDMTYVISSEEEGRPDLVAFKFWRMSTLQWLVLQYNNIVDVNEEFVAGKTIILPSYKRVIVEMLSKSVGPVARAF